ncbi:MAG TPA: MATE family efflux transporter [Candidatus Mediterraneibacter stercoripullorum]|nr:MATE family efflux transporter [Candidatus Mediterraneibacter stercoripullorum]
MNSRRSLLTCRKEESKISNAKMYGEGRTLKRNKYEIDMCNGSIMDKLISFSLPLMLSSILQLMFNAVDIIVVGRFSGSQALAAVGSTTALINIFTNLFIGISLGANVLAAHYYAAGRDKEMSEAVHTAITLALISGIIMAFVGAAASRLALELMDTPANVIDLSVTYMRIYFMGMPFFMLYNYGAAILRAVGDTKRPLIFLAVAGMANVVLDLLLVIVIPLGVAGVAIGTVTSQFVSCILVLWCLHRTEGSYQLRFSRLTIKWTYLKRIFQVGIPAGIQSTVINFSNAMLQSSVNSFGSTAMAGYTAANNILGFLYVAVNAVTQACMSFTSQNYSVGKQKRMDRVLADCMILSAGVAVVLGVGAYVFGSRLLGIYTSEADVIQCGLEILSITTVPYFLCGIMDLIPGALRGMGHSGVPMVLSVIGTVGTRILWIYVFFPQHRSLYFLFISYPASWIATILMQAVCFYFVRRKCVRQMKAEV